MALTLSCMRCHQVVSKCVIKSKLCQTVAFTCNDPIVKYYRSFLSCSNWVLRQLCFCHAWRCNLYLWFHVMKPLHELKKLWFLASLLFVSHWNHCEGLQSINIEMTLGTISFLVALEILAASNCLLAVSKLLILTSLDIFQYLRVSHYDRVM